MILCDDCSIQISMANQNYYMVTDKVWLEVNDTKEGMLCIECLEKRLGRKLKTGEVTDCLINRENPYMAPLVVPGLRNDGQIMTDAEFFAPTGQNPDGSINWDDPRWAEMKAQILINNSL